MNNNINELDKTDGRKFDLPPLTIITLLICTILFGGLSALSPLSVFGVLFCAAAASCCAFVSALTSSLLPLLTAPVSIALAGLFTRSVSGAITGAAFLPCAAALIFAYRRKSERTPTILMISSSLGVCVLIYTVVDIFLTQSSLSMTALTEYYNNIISGISGEFSALGAAEDMVAMLVNYLLMLSPAIAVCMLTFTGFFTCSMYASVCRIFKLDEKYLPSYPWRFKVSSVSAYVFIAAYIASVLFSGDNMTALSMTASNLIVILTPPFMLIGAAAAVRNLRKRSGGMAVTVVIVISVILFFMFLTAFMFALSVYGVIDTIIESVKIRRNNNDNK